MGLTEDEVVDDSELGPGEGEALRVQVRAALQRGQHPQDPKPSHPPAAALPRQGLGKVRSGVVEARLGQPRR